VGGGGHDPGRELSGGHRPREDHALAVAPPGDSLRLFSWVRWRCGVAWKGRGCRLGGWVTWPFGRGAGHLPLPMRGGRSRRMSVYFYILGLLALLLCGPALQRAAYCGQWLPGPAAAARLRVKVSSRLRGAASAPSASVADTTTNNMSTMVPMRWASHHTRAVAARACCACVLVPRPPLHNTSSTAQYLSHIVFSDQARPPAPWPTPHPAAHAAQRPLRQ